MTSLWTSPIHAFAIASLLISGAYLYSTLHYRRFRQNAHIPHLPSSLLWGHLLTFDRLTKQGATDRHPDAIFAEMHQALGKPPIMLVDNWPIVPPMVIVASHEVAEQVSKPSNHFPLYSAPKSPSVDRIVDLIGQNSILFKQNERWKAVRKRFNPGFAPQHLMTLLPVIVEKATQYLEIIDLFARTGKAFSLDQVTTNVTFDIIGAVTMDEDMRAQSLDPAHQGELICMFKELIKTYLDDKLQLPWWLMPRVHFRRRQLGKRISAQLKIIVQRNFDKMHGEALPVEPQNKSRSVLALSLQDVESLTPEIMEETCDQLKTFLFAGHDSTSSTISWSIYELFRTPHALQAVRDELDRLFGSTGDQDMAATRKRLLAPGGDEIVHQMTYISAVIKETLRLHPPAGSIRMSKPKTGFVVSTTQGNYNLDGNWIYLNHSIIQRDRAVYGETTDTFVPERWLQSEHPPASAWRPFERGPRSCIGLELANIEARIIVCLLVRHFDFVKVGLGETDLDQNGQPVIEDTRQLKVKSDMYSTIQISGKPVDGMMMRVSAAPLVH
ncbi:hypothetical protein LQW54_004334 [Pestalotiopsis sp. IQ-011]